MNSSPAISPSCQVRLWKTHWLRRPKQVGGQGSVSLKPFCAAITTGSWIWTWPSIWHPFWPDDRCRPLEGKQLSAWERVQLKVELPHLQYIVCVIYIRMCIYIYHIYIYMSPLHGSPPPSPMQLRMGCHHPCGTTLRPRAERARSSSSSKRRTSSWTMAPRDLSG